MKNQFMVLVLAVFVLMASAGIGSAADIIVPTGGSIQTAIDNATTGDRVIVQPGTYNGDLITNDNVITLMSRSGNSDTIINGLVDVGMEGPTTGMIINGFTFKGSNSGVFTSDSQYTVKNCKFMYCGSGLLVGDGGSVTALNNQFIKCGAGISGLPFSHIHARNNKFIDCDEAIFDSNYENTIEAKNNIVTNTSKPVNKVTTPISNPEPKTPIKTSTNDVATAEPTSTSNNIHAKEVVQVIADDRNVTLNFTNNSTCVESITFTSDEIMGKILAIVEELKNKLDSIPCFPEGKVYKFFNICIETDDLNCIRNASINFSVNNSWIQENNINQSSITLNEFNNTSEEWDILPTNITGNDSQAVHCTANVTNYSSFAITANESNAVTV